MLEHLRSMQAEIDRILHAIAPSKEEWSEMIDVIDHRYRCHECNGIIGRHHLFASLLRLSNALSDAVEELERCELTTA
jgi:hypothetical protein